MTRRAIVLALTVGLLLAPLFVRGASAQEQQAVARTIIGLYDSRREPEIRLTRIHKLIEMPLNHLGLKVEFRDIAAGLPDPKSLEGVRGVVTFFDAPVPDPGAYVDWATAVLDRGIRYAVLGEIGAAPSGQGVGDDRRGVALENMLQRIGLRFAGRYVRFTHRARIVQKTPWMVEFEKPLPTPLPSYDVIRAAGSAVKSHLTIQVGDDAELRSDLVGVGPQGGWVAPGYAIYHNERLNKTRWLINPFEFFKDTFADEEMPVPDTTTIVGRRIYYSHIDGDGWRSLTEINGRNADYRKAADIVLRKAIEPYPSLPVTVAPVAADLHPDWEGDEQDRAIAREIFALPQVEAGSHTWTHPLEWQFFANYQLERELAYKQSGPVGNGSMDHYHRGGLEGLAKERHNYDRPRSFDQQPFDLNQEIAGSIDYINQLLPPGKRTSIIQWSGDASPFQAAVAAADAAGVPNINSGETRLEEEYPSYSYVSPVGRPVGEAGLRQIYASASNENTYTELWTGRFFGFRHLEQTVKRTNTPYRVKPFNIYYHMYSGSKQASLNAILSNLDLAEASDIAPVTTSTFALIAQGFYTTRIVDMGDRRWRIENRGKLQTLRFDHATFTGVDFSRSKGVIGQYNHQGSLYVALDPADPEPVIALHDLVFADRSEPADRPYLRQSRWLVSGLAWTEHGWSLTAEGFGPGEMDWQTTPGFYDIRVKDQAGTELAALSATADEDGVLTFTLDTSAVTPVTVQIERVEAP
jgi:polysaccharide biosynthesis protein PelA